MAAIAAVAAATTTPAAATNIAASMDRARDTRSRPPPRSAGRLRPGVFLWSRRNQISDQIGSLADQISEWREGMSVDNAAFRMRPVGGVHGKPGRRVAAAEPDGDFGRSPDAEGNRARRRLRGARDPRGVLTGAPFLMRVRKRAIASPNSDLVTELICVPGTSSKIAAGRPRRAPPPSRCPRPRCRTRPALAW